MSCLTGLTIVLQIQVEYQFPHLYRFRAHQKKKISSCHFLSNHLARTKKSTNTAVTMYGLVHEVSYSSSSGLMRSYAKLDIGVGVGADDSEA